MKALIRNEGETVLESDGIEGIDWKTGAPLTNPVWAGGPYQLVDNYIDLADGAIYDVAVYPEPEDDTPVPSADTIVIDGKKYSKEELRSLLE